MSNTLTPAPAGWSVVISELPGGLDSQPEHHVCPVVGWIASPPREYDLPGWQPVFWADDELSAVPWKAYHESCRLHGDPTVLTMVGPGAIFDQHAAEDCLYLEDRRRTMQTVGTALQPFQSIRVAAHRRDWFAPDGSMLTITLQGGQERPFWPAEVVLTRSIDGAQVALADGSPSRSAEMSTDAPAGLLKAELEAIAASTPAERYAEATP